MKYLIPILLIAALFSCKKKEEHPYTVTYKTTSSSWMGHVTFKDVTGTLVDSTPKVQYKWQYSFGMDHFPDTGTLFLRIVSSLNSVSGTIQVNDSVLVTGKGGGNFGVLLKY